MRENSGAFSTLTQKLSQQATFAVPLPFSRVARRGRNRGSNSNNGVLTRTWTCPVCASGDSSDDGGSGGSGGRLRLAVAAAAAAALLTTGGGVGGGMWSGLGVGGRIESAHPSTSYAGSRSNNANAVVITELPSALPVRRLSRSAEREMLKRLSIAISCGAIIGMERRAASANAGVRTLALVSLGSAIFTLTALLSFRGDAARMGAAVSTGIGFLGAGAINSDTSLSGSQRQLVTAASIWIAAALGVAAASGLKFLALLGALVTVFILRWTVFVGYVRFLIRQRIPGERFLTRRVGSGSGTTSGGGSASRKTTRSHRSSISSRRPSAEEAS